MTKRTCPWCGDPNLHITNITGSTGTINWEDRECGYREQTGYKDTEGSGIYPFRTCHEPRQRKPDYISRNARPGKQRKLVSE